tara:strand:- start:310 stop:528 length:219 start_codon:yes stop_codon:yes gene_type:complete
MNQQAVTYEVAVFNQAVRDAMKEGERHPFLKDDWADIHWIEVRAYSPDAARQKIEVRYPSFRGYVITEIQEA